MTAKKDLKRLVRERQQRTGEHYTTALRHVLAQRDALAPGVPVVELVDLSAEAAELGMTCRAAMVPALAERVGGRRLLERVRAALRATHDDPATALLRGAVLDGERPPGPSQVGLEAVDEGRRFMARARAGIGGTSASGRMLALPVEGTGGPVMVVCLLWGAPLPLVVDRPPLLIFSTTAGLFEDTGWAEYGLR